MERKEVADVLPLLQKGKIIEHLDADKNVTRREQIDFLIDSGKEWMNQFALVVSILPDKQCGALLDTQQLAIKIRSGAVRIVSVLVPAETTAK